MDIKVYRYNSDKEHSNSVMLIDKRFKCHGIEDEHRNIKVWGETRVADGKYKIGFRKEGGFHNRYLKKFGASFHKGMLEIKDVPDFTYVLIHIGNSDKDTAACYIVGTDVQNADNWVTGSEKAYKLIYPEIRDALLRNEEVTIEFITLDEPVKN